MAGLAIFINLCYTGIPTTTSGVFSLFAMSSFWFQPFSRARKAPKTLACLARRHGDSWELDSTPLRNLPATPNWQNTIENVDSQRITFRPKYVNVFRRFFSCVVFGLVIGAGLMDSKSEVLGGWWNVIVTRIWYYRVSFPTKTLNVSCNWGHEHGMAILYQRLSIGSWWINEQRAILGWLHSLTADQHFSIQM